MEPINPANPSPNPPKPPSDPPTEPLPPSPTPPETPTDPPVSPSESSPGAPETSDVPSAEPSSEAGSSPSTFSPDASETSVAPETPQAASESVTSASAPSISQVLPSDSDKTPPPPPFSPSESENIDPPAVSGPTPAQPSPSASQLAQPQPMPKVMVGDGGGPAIASVQGQGSPIVTSVGAGAVASGSARRFLNKRVAIPVASVVVLLVAAAIFYFGYYMNPSVIYSQSLADMGKGYDRLIDYADKQSKAKPAGYTGSGSYTITSEGTTVDGKINFKSDNKNADLAVDLGVSGTRVNADFRTIKGSADVPDVYVKVGGIKGLGTMFGSPQLEGEFDKLDNNWIVVDHTLVDQLNAGAGQSGKVQLPSREQILDEARAFGEVNKQYLFTTDKDKAVTKVVKKYGKETVDGHKTYHYLVALQKDNVKKYILAQRDALKSSKLNGWLKQNKLDTSVYKSFEDAADSTKDIKSSDTFDLWADTGQRVVYKIRVKEDKNAANNYVDIGLNYKGGSDYPFFFSGKSQDSSASSTTTYSFVTDINTDTGATGFKLNAKENGSERTTVEADFSYKPSKSAPKIDKPANAIPLTQVLNDLGLGGALNSAAAGGTGGIQLRDDISGTNKPANTSPKAIDSSWLRQLLGQ